VVLKRASHHGLAAMLDGMRVFRMGFSWGGFESLIIPFDPRATRTATAWTDEGPCLRLHCGLENMEDLLGDLDAGFARLYAAG
jgi:cystathionine beta-lyase